MIVSHLNYCILAWGYEHSRLNKIQKRVIRIINNSKYNAHTEPLFKKLKLLKIEDILKLNEIKFYYKLTNGKLPVYFQHQTITNNAEIDRNDTHFSLKQNNEIHEHNTRSKNKLHITRTNHNFAQKCLRQNLPHTINDTPTQILNKIKTHSIERIKNDVKALYIDRYNENCTILKCHICNKT